LIEIEMGFRGRAPAASLPFARSRGFRATPSGFPFSAIAASVVFLRIAFRLVRPFFLTSIPRESAMSIFCSTRSCGSSATSATSLTMRKRARSSIRFSRKERLFFLLRNDRSFKTPATS
jgi:hypothetical protein